MLGRQERRRASLSCRGMAQDTEQAGLAPFLSVLDAVMDRGHSILQRSNSCYAVVYLQTSKFLLVV